MWCNVCILSNVFIYICVCANKSETENIRQYETRKISPSCTSGTTGTTARVEKSKNKNYNTYILYYAEKKEENSMQRKRRERENGRKIHRGICRYIYIQKKCVLRIDRNTQIFSHNFNILIANGKCSVLCGTRYTMPTDANPKALISTGANSKRPQCTDTRIQIDNEDEPHTINIYARNRYSLFYFLKYWYKSAAKTMEELRQPTVDTHANRRNNFFFFFILLGSKSTSQRTFPNVPMCHTQKSRKNKQKKKILKNKWEERQSDTWNACVLCVFEMTSRLECSAFTWNIYRDGRQPQRWQW